MRSKASTTVPFAGAFAGTAVYPNNKDVTGEPVVDRTIETEVDPTSSFYGTVRRLFEVANLALWDGSLPSNVLFTVNVSRGAIGTYKHARWRRINGDKADEIAFHGGYLRAYKGQEFVQTMVHECCHLWQYHFGKPGKRGYHNKEFAAEMRRVGLEPINIGAGPGTDTGYSVADRIIDGGATERLYKTLLDQGFEVTWAYATQLAVPPIDTEALDRERKRRSKTRYSCQSCELNAWAKPEAALICGKCRIAMQPDGSTP